MITYGPGDATATPLSLAPVKSRMIYLLVLAYPGCPGKRPLNKCSSNKRKRKEVYLYSAFIVATTLKALRRGSHSFTCK